MVLTTIIVIFEVKRILVDIKSTTNPHSSMTFCKMNLLKDRLWPIKTALHGFGGVLINPEGIMKLLITYRALTDDNLSDKHPQLVV